MDYKLLILIILFVLFFLILIRINKLRLMAYKCFLKAEHLFNNGDNRMDYVVEQLYGYLPMPFRVFIGEDLFRKLLQYFFNEIKDLLDDGKFNKSIKE